MFATTRSGLICALERRVLLANGPLDDLIVYENAIFGGIFVSESNGDDEVEVAATAPNPSEPVFTPDRSGVIYSSVLSGGGGNGIWIIGRDGSNETQLSTGPDSEPAVNANGTRIAFVSNRDGNNEIYTMDPNGGDLRRRIELRHPQRRQRLRQRGRR